MGARAHNRRREGRRIRKMRRQLQLVTNSFEEMADAMTLFGNAVMQSMSQMAEFIQRYELVDLGMPGVVALRDTRDGTVTVGVDPGVPYPTQTGVEDATEPSTASERIEESMRELGIELTPSQREFAANILSGKPVSLARGYGKSATGQVVKHAMRGVSADLAYIDESSACERGCPDCAGVTERAVGRVRAELEAGS